MNFLYSQEQICNLIENCPGVKHNVLDQQPSPLFHHIHTYIHTYIYTYIHTYIHTVSSAVTPANDLQTF